jgi:hypothetical protein
VVGAILVALLVGIVMRVSHDAAVRTGATAEAARMLAGGDLWVGNPDRFDLAAGEAMVLHGNGIEIRVTPGRVSRRADACHSGSVTFVPLSVAVISGRAEVEASSYRLRTADGQRLDTLQACADGPLSLGAGDEGTLRLAFAGGAPARLEYGAGPDACWRLA